VQAPERHDASRQCTGAGRCCWPGRSRTVQRGPASDDTIPHTFPPSQAPRAVHCQCASCPSPRQCVRCSSGHLWMQAQRIQTLVGVLCCASGPIAQGDAEFDRLVAAQWQSGAGARWSLAQGWPPLRFASWCLFNQRIAEPKHRQSLCVYTERRRRTAWSRPVRSAMRHVEHSLPCVVPAHLLVVKLLPLRRLCTQRKEPVVLAARV